MTDQMFSANRVLASIPSKEFKRLRSHLEPVSLKFGGVLNLTARRADPGSDD